MPAPLTFTLGPAPESSANFNPLPGVTLEVPTVDANLWPVGGVRFPDADYPVGEPTPVSIPPVSTQSISTTCGNMGGWQPYTQAQLTQRYQSEANYLSL